MKKFLMYALLVMAASACSNNDDPDNSSPANNLSKDQWKLSYFYDGNVEETANYTGYTFEFKDDGSLQVYPPGGSTQAGTWHFHDQNTKFSLLIPGTDLLDKISGDDWDVTETTDTSLKLKDDNTSKVEELFLEKI